MAGEAQPEGLVIRCRGGIQPDAISVNRDGRGTSSTLVRADQPPGRRPTGASCPSSGPDPAVCSQTPLFATRVPGCTGGSTTRAWPSWTWPTPGDIAHTYIQTSAGR
ncbi:MAG: hypothetical protein ACRDQD_31970 [Nocardioidaceae bacterium]